MLRRQCAYGVLFEPIPPSDDPTPQFADAPRPYVITVPYDPGRKRSQTLTPGSPLTFDLTLVGPAVPQLPYFVYSTMQLSRRGIGRQKGTARLERVTVAEEMQTDGTSELFDGETLRATPPALAGDDLSLSWDLSGTERLTVRFHTPIRLKLDGSYTCPLTFHDLMRGVVNRVKTLTRFYGEEVDPSALEELLDAAREVRTVENRQTWWDLTRYSTRQKTRLKMGGAYGWATFEAEDFAPFAPLLALGEWLHIGKLTTMGLGRFEAMTE